MQVVISTLKQVEKNQPKDEHGQMIDPNTKKSLIPKTTLIFINLKTEIVIEAISMKKKINHKINNDGN